MEGGTSIVFRHSRILSFGKFIPLSWWVPQKERAVLAVASTLFWACSILQAIQKDPAGASILAFYGLGLFYVVCGMANISSGLRAALTKYRRHWHDTEQPRSLLQLFGVLASMLIFNVVVLMIYVDKGATLTALDKASLLIVSITIGVLVWQYGLGGAFRHPFARAYLAIACKAMPQILLAALFVLKPAMAGAFTMWSLASLTVLAGLRFWPSMLAFKRDTKSMPLRGLLLGEAGNMASIIVMVTAWCYARL